MSTMIALAMADSRVPRINSTAHSTIKMTAGRFTTPASASHGAADNACGSWNPVTLCSSLLTYPLQPTATAAVDTPYSSRRQAATPIATASPNVA
ncbi:Uncharacterised protein [Mycobacterium tuberculosis]|nr:Uncharacterised protein [Mycobacterium tuberculosis]